jgi:hypothetical protein
VPANSRSNSAQAGLGAGEIDAVSEAAMLAVAMAANRAGQSPSSTHRQTYAPRGGTDLRTEISCLVADARAFITSPVVARTVELLTGLTRLADLPGPGVGTVAPTGVMRRSASPVHHHERRT